MNPPVETYDAIVVGGGPAGSHAALRLAREGLRVALVDRKRFPRDKPCGEFMSPECVPLLRDVGLEDAVRLEGAARVRGMEIFGHGWRAEGRFGRVPRRPVERAGYALRRERLDALAFSQASTMDTVDAFSAHAVLGLRRDPDGRVCGVSLRGPSLERRELQAPLTVGADGLRSRVARELGVRTEVPWLRKFAIVVRFEGVTHRPTAEVHYVPGGYMAACPVDDGLFTLNLVVDQAALPAAGRAALEEFVWSHVRQAPVLADRLAKASVSGPILTCGPLAGGTRDQVADGVALVGDACGYVDPMTGEGLFFAMRGAELLAESAIPELLRRRGREAPLPADVLRPYARRRKRAFGHRYAVARLLQRGLRHPRVVDRILSTLAGRPALADLMVALTGESPRLADVVSPRLWTRVLVPHLADFRDPPIRQPIS